MGISDENEAIDVVARAVDRIKRRGRFAEFRLTNGIVLKMKPVPPLLLSAIQSEFKPPKPPMVMNTDKGREEENPNDPTYLREMEEFVARQDAATNDLVLAIGTEVISVPEGYYLPEQDNWIAKIEFANRLTGVELIIDRDDPVKRYLQWLRFYAIETTTDGAMAAGIPMQLIGIREGEVEEVIDYFRDLQTRSPDPASASETVGTNRDPTALDY